MPDPTAASRRSSDPTPASRRAPTIHDVAAAAGVSKSLVSMVLRGDPGVTPARRDRVLAAVRAIGYRPNRAAAILAGHRTQTVGVVLDDYRNLWYVSLLCGIQEALAPHGLRVTVADTTLNAHIRTTPFDDLVSLRVDGIVIATEPSAALVVPDRLPVVVAGERSVAVEGSDVVANDERIGGRLATEHLLALGHRRIGHLTGSGGAAAVRASAYRSTMAAAGLASVVRGDGGTTEADGYAAALDLFRDRPDVTAVFAANDTMAMGALGAARELGIRVPGDVSVIGYDDSPIAASPLLQLTTIDARSADVGRAAAEVLVRRLGELDGDVQADATATRTLLEPALVVRASTAPVAP
jgi:DNA-binding LacI/PurR family transcriptional regulator